MSSARPGRELTEHTISTARHTTGYIASGREDGPLMIFVHGWPELSLSWRHQLPCFASLGFRAVASDLRGYGRSSVYRDHASYALEHIVHDMLEMLDAPPMLLDPEQMIETIRNTAEQQRCVPVLRAADSRS